MNAKNTIEVVNECVTIDDVFVGTEATAKVLGFKTGKE